MKEKELAEKVKKIVEEYQQKQQLEKKNHEKNCQVCYQKRILEKQFYIIKKLEQKEREMEIVIIQLENYYKTAKRERNIYRKWFKLIFLLLGVSWIVFLLFIFVLYSW